MRSLLYTFLSFLLVTAGLPVFAQQGSWPKSITTGAGTEIKVFEFQPQSLNGNNLSLQAAISLKEAGSAEPVFGMMWGDAEIEKDQNVVTRITKLTVSNLKVPGVSGADDVNELKSILQEQVPSFALNLPVGELLSGIAANENQSRLSAAINTAPPKIIYAKNASILVYIDGEPQLQKNNSWGVEQVVNTPFTIIKNNDQRYYLYGNKKWFTANSVTGNWSYISDVPSSLRAVDQEVRKADTSSVSDNIIPNVIVSTVPAELIQSKGEANFAPVQGTNLLYMTNTSNDVFMDISSQQYYVLISGRWYKSPNLNSSWTYTSSANLPADFSKIPEGSAKDVVLANIAGTAAAEESVLDAQVPQTAKVDRKTATATVDYDGEPQFEQIEGTDMKYAVNTPGAVINSGRKYYYVENGVWFESYSANGPWSVATERPAGVENIPPTSPVYNVKYVYIYDATPDYVYMGYTPGYLGTYVYGNTIVYGTGYHYRPWRGRHYYARPVTWGFNMRYNPWSGWNFGISFGSGWFFSEVGSYNYFGWPVSMGGCSYGWWGQSVYRPQYARRYSNYYGRNVIINNNYIVSNNRQNNVYRSRRDVVTYDRSPRYDNRNNRNGGYAQNNRAGGNGNYGNTNRRYQGGQDISDNRNGSSQRQGRFGQIQQRNNDGNVSNNRAGNQQSNGLPGQRSGRVYNPQNNGQANAGDVTDRTNDRNNSANNRADGTGRFGTRRNQNSSTDASNPATNNGGTNNPGNRYGRNTTPAQDNVNDNSGINNRLPGRFGQQQRTTIPSQNNAGNGNVSEPRNQGDINNSAPTERPQRVISSQRNMERQSPAPAQQQQQRVFQQQRNIDRSSQNPSSNQPQRVYTPQQRNVERQQPAQSQNQNQGGVESRRRRGG